MLLPERTVDSLLAADVVRYSPYAQIWSPTQTAGSVDHSLRLQGRLFAYFECKGIDDNGDVPFDKVQLDNYMKPGEPFYGEPVSYLLPVSPPQAPWVRMCSGACCSGRHCRSCVRDERSWAGLEPDFQPYGAWNDVDRLRAAQPWFSHWAWIVSPADLSVELQRRRGLKKLRLTEYLPGEDSEMASFLDPSQRLCHVLYHARRGLAGDVFRRFSDNDLFLLTDEERVIEEEEEPLLVVLGRTALQG